MNNLDNILEAHQTSAAQLARATYLEVLKYLGTLSRHLTVGLNAIDVNARNWNYVNFNDDNGHGLNNLIAYKTVALGIKVTMSAVILTFPTVNYTHYNCSYGRLPVSWAKVYPSGEKLDIEARRWPTFQSLRTQSILWSSPKSCTAKVRWYRNGVDVAEFLATLETAYKRYLNAESNNLLGTGALGEAKAMRLYILKRGNPMLALYNASLPKDKQVTLPPPPPAPPKLKKKK